jgi:hypothetical protein
MIKAYILVITDPGATRRVFEALKEVPDVTARLVGPFRLPPLFGQLGREAWAAAASPQEKSAADRTTG